jgi:hypothetical protein
MLSHELNSFSFAARPDAALSDIGPPGMTVAR